MKMSRCEVKMCCEDVKMFDRPPLLEEPFAQTRSGKKSAQRTMETAWNFYVPASNVDNRKLHNRKATPQFAVINFAFDLAFHIGHA